MPHTNGENEWLADNYVRQDVQNKTKVGVQRMKIWIPNNYVLNT